MRTNTIIADCRYTKNGEEASCAVHVTSKGAKGLAQAAKYIASQGGKITRFSCKETPWIEECQDSEGGNRDAIQKAAYMAKKEADAKR